MKSNGKKILVIDDESPVAEMVSEFCKSFGFTTKVLHSGVDAMEEVRRFSPDLILLDLLMPAVSGSDVLKSLKSNPETQKIPVVIISVVSDEDAVNEVLKLSQGFLSKPLKMSQLKDKIESIFAA